MIPVIETTLANPTSTVNMDATVYISSMIDTTSTAATPFPQWSPVIHIVTVTTTATPTSCSDQQQSSTSSDSDDVVSICVPVIIVVGIIIVIVLVIVGGVVWWKIRKNKGGTNFETIVYKHQKATALVENDLYG